MYVAIVRYHCPLPVIRCTLFIVRTVVYAPYTPSICLWLLACVLTVHYSWRVQTSLLRLGTPDALYDQGFEHRMYLTVTIWDVM